MNRNFNFAIEFRKGRKKHRFASSHAVAVIYPKSISLKTKICELSRATRILTILFIVSLLAISVSVAQNQKRIIQLSGIILGPDSMSVVPGAHIYVPKAGRGTTSNRTGFFSMPVLVGDSVVVSFVGYERQHYIVPRNASEYQTVIVEMIEDATFLKEITVMPFPTEEVFKEAVLAMNMPMNDNGIDKRNLNSELMELMLRTTPMDGAANYRYYMDQYPGSINDKFSARTNPFLNVFNWVNFIRQLKKDRKNR